jgi:hypothetical protein
MKVSPYTARAKSGNCARCGAAFREGDAAEAVVTPGIVEHRHATCERSAQDGAALGARLMNDIRDGKPVINPAPKRKVQGT